MENTPSFNKPSIGRDSVLDEENRPAKRRRHSLADQLSLAHEVGSLRQALRVQVLGIVDGDAAKIRISDPLAETTTTTQYMETQARCKLTLNHVSPAGDTILHCHSQVCTLKTFDYQAVVPCRNILIKLPRPFDIHEDSIYVNRDDDNRFYLGDAYRLSVELEATGEGNWPPLDPASLLPPSSLSPPSPPDLRRWVFTGETNDVFGKHCSMVKLQVKMPFAGARDTKYLDTKYRVDVDIKWTPGYEASAIRPLEKEPCCTVNGGSPSPLKKTTANGVAVTVILNGDDDDDVDGEVTPKRSLRTRSYINYNLKDLSRKAEGKEANNRRGKELREVNEGHVIYDVPAHTVHLTSFRCVSCGFAHGSLAALQAHLKPRCQAGAHTSAKR